jgi:hypothetical protein
MTNNRLMMLPLLTILTLALSACEPGIRKICQSHDDCPPCEQCINDTCVLDESRLNACGVCDRPDPEEVCGDGLDNDCDGETDESCAGSCVGVVCDSPPPNACLDENTLRSYSANGDCENGDCTYAYNDIVCVEGCQDGLCKEDPCAGVVCDDPPSQCHQSPGTCVGGSCQYGYLDGATCDDSDACTRNDTCSSGVCAGTPMICDSPPPDECADASTLMTYATNGSCAGGVCTYTNQLIPCNDPPDACHQAAGRCAEASCQYDPVTACIDSDGCCPPGCAGQDDDCPAQSSWGGVYGSSDFDWAYSVWQTSDGGYIVAGSTYSFGVGAATHGFKSWTRAEVSSGRRSTAAQIMIGQTSSSRHRTADTS